MIHSYGLAKVFGFFVTVKCVKVTCVYWRSVYVNAELDRQLKDRLDELALDAAIDTCCVSAEVAAIKPAKDIALPGEEQLEPCGEGACAACGEALGGEGACGVKLCECGCTMHHGCFMEAARDQLGVCFPQCCRKVPGSFDEFDESFEAAFAVIGRFFGVSEVTARRMRCPRHHSWSETWRLVGSLEPRHLCRADEKVAASLEPKLLPWRLEVYDPAKHTDTKVNRPIVTDFL